MFSSGGIEVNQAVKHWKHLVNFTEEMITLLWLFLSPAGLGKFLWIVVLDLDISILPPAP